MEVLLCYGGVVGVGLDDFDGIAWGDKAGMEDFDVKAAVGHGLEEAYYRLVAEADAEFEAWFAWACDFSEYFLADAEDIAPSDVVFVEVCDGEVFAKHAVMPVELWEPLLPVGVVVFGVEVARFVGAAVHTSVGYGIAFDAIGG